MLSEKNPFVSPEALHERLKASAKSVLLKSIKFKEAMHPDEEEENIKEKYKPINPQFQQTLSGSRNDIIRNGNMAATSSSSLDMVDDMPKPKVILFPPEKVELNWKETRKIGPGLCNLGNTCFLNSVLQALTYTAPLVNFIGSDTHRANCESIGFCMLCELRNHFFRVLKHHPQAGPIRPLAIVQKLSYIGKQFKFGRQEDAHEFLRYVIEGLQKSCLAGKPKLDKMSRESTVMNQIFGGFYRSQVTCLACKHKSNTYDPMLEMNLDIKESNSIENALRRSVRPERLDGENKYQCDRCRGKRPAIKRSTIHKSPNVFTVQFKRFDFNRIIGGKVTKYVSYSEELNLRPFMSITEGQPVLYGLYAVLVHSGFSCNSGHYYCYVKAPNGAWYEMNDSRVSQVSLKTVLNTEAYLLFYIRKQSRDKKVLNGNVHTNQAQQGNGAQIRPSPVQAGKSTSHIQHTKDTPKESRPCPKMIPLNFNHNGKLSFKFSKSNSLKDVSGASSKSENALKSQKSVSGDVTQTGTATSKTGSRKPFIGLGSMESLKMYNSDDSSEGVPESTGDSATSPAKTPKDPKQNISVKDNVQSADAINVSDTNSDTGTCTTSKSNKKFTSISSTDRIINKIKHMAVNVKSSRKNGAKDMRQGERKDSKQCELKGGEQAEPNDIKQSEERTNATNESTATRVSATLNEPSVSEGNKENVSTNCCKSENGNGTKCQDTSFKLEQCSSEKSATSCQETKSKLSRNFIKSALFSPPQIPSMKSWIRSKNTLVPRSIFKRSVSEPAGTNRKINETDATQTGGNGTEGTGKTNKWVTLERQKSEHLFGPMTPPPLKENNPRERTNSINSEASSVASVSSKIGEWEVHEKEQEEIAITPKIPERQFAGWDVVEQNDNTKAKNFSQCNGSIDNESTVSKTRKTKKKKKKRKKKRIREKDPERTTLIMKPKRKRRKMDDSDESVEEEEISKPRKKRKKSKIDSFKDSVRAERKQCEKVSNDETNDCTNIHECCKDGRKRPEDTDATGKLKKELVNSVDDAKKKTLLTDSVSKKQKTESESKHRSEMGEQMSISKSKQNERCARKHSSSREGSSSRENSVLSSNRSSEGRGSVFSRDIQNSNHEREESRKSNSRDRSSSKESDRKASGKVQSEEKEAASDKISKKIHIEDNELGITKKYSDSFIEVRVSKKRKLKDKRKAERERDHSADSSDSASRYKISHKKKKRKDKSRSSSKDNNRIEGSAINGRHTKHDKDVPSKDWDDDRAVIESTAKTDILDTLFQDRSRALGQKVKSWDGGENEIDATKAPDERRRRRDKWDDEYDQGRKKKLKQHRKQSKTKHRTFNFNPFQRVQNVRNSKESA